MGEGIEFLTAVGQICSPTRQEFILLSDTLGLSTLVTAQNRKKPDGCTEATVFGPFYVQNVPQHDLGAEISDGLSGVPVCAWLYKRHPCQPSAQRCLPDSGVAWFGIAYWDRQQSTFP
ncbi:dioxygenase [Pseudomonas putida]|uniref:dioxygenase n=1 Tax=Pseudomonas putida TaxID=303 RepID=UPI000CBAE725|nr:dioxygenase [Pseudomonas putida]PNG88202.1 Hydroxyquinol 1,2-dioxygenase [Pseudomonas putida]